MTNFFNGRSIIDSTGRPIKITIPAKKNIFPIIGAIVILLVYFFASFLLVYSFDLVDSNSINFLFLLAVFFILLVIGPTMFFLLYNLFGQENLVVHPDKFITSKKLFGMEFSYREYLKKHLKNFRYNVIDYEKNPYTRFLFHYSLGTGNIKFDYGLKTHAVAFGLDEPESNYLIDFIQEKMEA